MTGAALGVWLGAMVSAQPCQPYWVRPIQQPILGGAYSLAVFDDGSGLALYAGGGMRPSPSSLWVPFGRWSGRALTYLDKGLLLGASGNIWIANAGTAQTVYGWCSVFQYPPAPPFLRKEWAPPSWVDPNQVFYGKRGAPALSYDDGSELIIYGLIPDYAPYSPHDGTVARWTGTKWEPLGNPAFGHVYRDAMIVYDDGSGPTLHVATPSGAHAAKWNGNKWIDLPDLPGIGHAPAGVYDLCVYDSGSGPELYFAGSGSGTPGGIVRWNGTEWRDVGGGFAPPGPASVYGAHAMEVFDDGTGPALFVTGSFAYAGGAPARNIAKWDGTRWHPLGAGLAPPGQALAVYDDGRGLSLFVGLTFGAAGPGSPASVGAGEAAVLAQWVGCIGQCYPDCNNDGAVTVADFGCFQTKYVSRDPYADCNVDGAFAPADFACFQGKYVLGCP